MRFRMAVLTLLIGCFFITGAVLQPAAFAESADTEKVVRIRVPACAWHGSADQVRYTLEDIDGVRKVKTDFMNHEVTVNYDGTKTGPEEMVKALNDKGFIVQGTPRVVN